jgi:hypothetical protein
MVKGRERQPDPRHVCVLPPANSVILVLVVNGHNGSVPSSITDSLGTHMTYTLDKQAGNANATLWRLSTPLARV